MKKSKVANFGSFSMYGDEALPQLDTDMTPQLTSKTDSMGSDVESWIELWKWTFWLKTSIEVDWQEYICENLQNWTILGIQFFGSKFSSENEFKPIFHSVGGTGARSQNVFFHKSKALLNLTHLSRKFGPN